MDYRRSLFQLEQWSPALARKFWGLKSFVDAPFALALGLKVNELSDLNVEIEIPVTRLNKSESGHIRPAILVAAGEFASKILWQRHLEPQAVELNLSSLHCRFLRPALTNVKVRGELVEIDRERMLRKIRSGGEAEFEMPVLFFDHKDQQIASLSCIWQMKAVALVALQQGRNNS